MKRKDLKIGDCVIIGQPSRGLLSYGMRKAYVLSKTAVVDKQGKFWAKVSALEGGNRIVVAEAYVSHLTPDTQWLPKIVSIQSIVATWDEYLVHKAIQDKIAAERTEKREAEAKARAKSYSYFENQLFDRGIKWRPDKDSYYFRPDEVHVPIKVLIQILDHTLPLTNKGPANE